MRERRPTTTQTYMPAGIPGTDAVRTKSGAENFPVALRFLQRKTRDDLLAVYGFARLADDIGDEYEGDRLAALDWLENDLKKAPNGEASHPLVASLTPTIHRHALNLDLFRDLINANRQDQRQDTYNTFDDLVDYCELSANPVGRLVLKIFGASTPRTMELSDSVCTGLQVVEHIQDIPEDLAKGRVYIPETDLKEYACTKNDFQAQIAPTRVRSLLEFECSRVRSLLSVGDELASLLPLQPRLAIAGFVAGGRAAVDSIADVNHDVLAHQCHPSSRNVFRHAAVVLWKANQLRRTEHKVVQEK